MNKNIELLVSAGSIEALKAAIESGADAVCAAGNELSINPVSGFSINEIKEAADYCRKNNKKFYVSADIFPKNNDVEKAEKYIELLSEADIDAIIVSDPSFFEMIRNVSSNIKIHLAAQANVANSYSAEFWSSQGADRICLSRELNLNEIRKINSRVSDKCETEIFVQGSMVIAISGRSLLSNYMKDTKRAMTVDEIKKHTYFMVEETRPDEYYRVLEDEHGSYILNKEELCLIKYIPEIIKSGVTCMRIEAALKDIEYVKKVTGAYRKTIDEYLSKKETFEFDENIFEEIKAVSKADIGTGFFVNNAE